MGSSPDDRTEIDYGKTEKLRAERREERLNQGIPEIKYLEYNDSTVKFQITGLGNDYRFQEIN